MSVDWIRHQTLTWNGCHRLPTNRLINVQTTFVLLDNDASLFVIAWFYGAGSGDGGSSMLEMARSTSSGMRIDVSPSERLKSPIKPRWFLLRNVRTRRRRCLFFYTRESHQRHIRDFIPAAWGRVRALWLSWQISELLRSLGKYSWQSGLTHTYNTKNSDGSPSKALFVLRERKHLELALPS